MIENRTVVAFVSVGVLTRKENEGILWSDVVLFLDLGFVIRIYGLPR